MATSNAEGYSGMSPESLKKRLFFVVDVAFHQCLPPAYFGNSYKRRFLFRYRQASTSTNILLRSYFAYIHMYACSRIQTRGGFSLRSRGREPSIVRHILAGWVRGAGERGKVRRLEEGEEGGVTL